MKIIHTWLTWCVVLYSMGYSTVALKPICPTIRLKNGRVRYRQKSGFVQSTCNLGYFLAGDKYMKCQKGKWEGVIPVCVRDTCKGQRAPTNGFVYPSHRGGVLNFFCKPGYELIGPATAFCDGSSWSTHLPVCSETNKTISVSCNFESEDICGWTHDLSHNFDWVRHNRLTPSSFIGTGPSYDHTLGRNQKGYYMYIEASAKNPNDRARLISPVYPVQGRYKCLAFWYHMYGASIGELRVYVREARHNDWSFNAPEAVWRRVGNHGNQWLKGQVELDSVGDDFQVIFEGVRGGNYNSDIAIDDVMLVESCGEVTTEEAVTDDGLGYIEGWSCYNRCGARSATALCACTSDCYEQGTCCPDYEAYCLDVDSSTVTEPSISTTQMEHTESSNSTSPSVSISSDAPITSATEATEVDDGGEAPPPSRLSDEVSIILDVATESVAQETAVPSTTITTTMPRTSTNIQPVPPRRKTPNRTEAAPRAKTPKGRGNTTPILGPAPEGHEVFGRPEVQQPVEKEPSHEKGPINKKEYMIKEMDVNGPVKVAAPSDGVDTQGGALSPSGIALTAGVVIALLAVVLVVKLRRRLVSACAAMRMRRGGASDSQSDVRFLTSDEVLDFSLASSTL